MALGTWRSPFPLRFGGGSTELISSFYTTMRAGRPELLRGEEGSEVDDENKMAARLLAAGWRSTERRLAQSDPLALTELTRPVDFPDGSQRTLSLLERWERILGLSPGPTASPQARRAAVKSRLVGVTSTRRSAVEDSMRAILGAWLIGLGQNRVSEVDYPGRTPAGNVHAFWSGPGTAEYPGETRSGWPWASALCQLTVHFRPPANTPQPEIDLRVAKASSVLDAQLPAWMVFYFSQWPAEQATRGFYAGVSLAGLTAV